MNYMLAFFLNELLMVFRLFFLKKNLTFKCLKENSELNALTKLIQNSPLLHTIRNACSDNGGSPVDMQESLRISFLFPLLVLH